jgi:hypothetical protein
MRTQTFHYTCVITAVLCIQSASCLAETFSLGPEADAFVTSGNPDSNYGGGGSLGVSAPGLPNGEFRALFRFDLAAPKASFDSAFGAGNWLLESVSLQLTAASPNNPLFNASAAGEIDSSWLQNDLWAEGVGTPSSPGGSGITWNTLPTFLSAGDEDLGAFTFDGATMGTAIYPLAVSSGFSADALSGSLASILLRPALGDTTVSALFNSRTFNNAANRPVLTLSAIAIPEPSSCILAGFGAVIVSLTRSKRFVR